MTRNVRWYEDRQDRASTRADRIGRYMGKLLDRLLALRAEARKTKSAKKRQALEDQAFRLEMRMRSFGDRADAARRESSRYGKAKTKVGKYDPTYGWSDRSASRSTTRLSRKRKARKSQQGRRRR